MIRQELSTICGPDTYSLPAAVVNGIAISDLAGNAHPLDWPGLVDTGADRTVVPVQVCRDLGLAPRDSRTPRGYDRRPSAQPIPLYYIRLHLEELGDIPLLSYGIRRPNVLLGRDFLSGLVFLLDAGASRWQLGQHTVLSRVLSSLLRFR